MIDKKIIEKFMSKIIISAENECWYWTGQYNRHVGYRFTFNGRNVSVKKFAYQLAYRVNLEKEDFVIQKCGNLACCNPKHLYLGSQYDKSNSVRNVYKGEKCKQSLLTEEQVIEILKEHKYNFRRGISSELAKKYNVALGTISSITSGRNWKHIDRDKI